METNRFAELARHTADPCLTVLMSIPVDTPSSRDSYINSVVTEAAQSLEKAGLSEETAESWTSDLADALRSDEMRSAGSLVYLRSAEESERWYVSHEFDRTVEVASGFVLAALHPLLSDGAEPVVLALSRGEWRLITRVNGSISHIDVPNAPKSLEEANSAFEQPIEGGAQHANTSHGTGPGAPRTHRQGFGHEDPDDKRDLRYVEALDRAFADALDTDAMDAGLIVVGLSPLAATFRDHTTVDVMEVLFADPQTMGDEALLDYVDQNLDIDAKDFDKRFDASRAKDMLLESPKTLLEQARAGNIELLRLPNEPTWMSPDTHTLHKTHESGDVELLTQLAGEVLAHGGKLVSGPSLAGIQRWPLHPTA